MKVGVIAHFLLLAACAPAAAEPQTAAAPAPEATLPLRARLTDEVVKQAVRDTLAQSRDRSAAADTGEVLSGDGYRAFSRTFSEARKPSCLGPDALKHQPAAIATRNWNIGLGGVFALPFWAAAIARGKCN